MRKGVVAIVLQGQRAILVRKVGDDRWLFPAGWIEDGEDEFQAAKREVLEEAGIECVPSMTLGNRESPFTPGVDLTYVLCNICLDDALSVRDTSEIEEARWFGVGDILDMHGDLVFGVVRNLFSRILDMVGE